MSARWSNPYYFYQIASDQAVIDRVYGLWYVRLGRGTLATPETGVSRIKNNIKQSHTVSLYSLFKKMYHICPKI